MNDTYDPESSGPERRDARVELIDLFLRRTVAEVEQMRRDVPRLIDGDDGTWRELRLNAQRIGGMAASLELGVLSACAGELAQLAEERFNRANVDAHFLLSVTSAIEMVAIELNELFRDIPCR
jgi:hypothetical protein